MIDLLETTHASEPLIVIEDLPEDAEGNHFPRALLAGDIVYAFYGPTYGCISNSGIAVGVEAGKYPVYEVPRKSVVTFKGTRFSGS